MVLKQVSPAVQELLINPMGPGSSETLKSVRERGGVPNLRYLRGGVNHILHFHVNILPK